MINCYIIDDEPHAISVLRKHIASTPGLEMTGSESNPVAALEEISMGKVKPDITFVDIDMPQLSGIELARLIKEKTIVVFTTAFPNFAVQAFDLDVLDYIVKPITYERFLKAVERARERLSAANLNNENYSGHFFIRTDNKRLLRIVKDDILYIEGKQNYIQIVQEKGKVLAYLSMTEIENRLPPSKFFRCHRSFIVNTDKIKSLNGDTVLLTGDKEILVGVTYREKFMEHIGNNIIRTNRS